MNNKLYTKELMISRKRRKNSGGFWVGRLGTFKHVRLCQGKYHSLTSLERAQWKQSRLKDNQQCLVGHVISEVMAAYPKDKAFSLEYAG